MSNLKTYKNQFHQKLYSFKKGHNINLLLFLQKSTIIDVWWGPKYTSANTSDSDKDKNILFHIKPIIFCFICDSPVIC